MMVHDFNKHPELTNNQMQFYYFQSPHKQIFEDFEAEVVRVVDGDTIRVRASFRDFDFPVRFLDTNAKEMSEGGEDAKSYLEDLLDGEQIMVMVDPKQRVGKWGRLLGDIIHRGISINEHMKMVSLSTSFENRDEGKIPNIDKELNLKRWF